ncbi:hypothetical protein BGZ65_002956 [Modicella reniformis]|uniref:Hemerythrin-like domain-containing protein n=1 Tax=Modicella reniformis TaxID=1440133 RepID=A0A9P6M9G6_9FUNG|nr:hypothetical protein BGZ65_002956 [Modicella reniformis]
MKRVSEAVKQDHRELEGYYNKILNGANDDERTRWQNQFIWELARHSVGEELVVYPAMEKYLPNGKELADKDRNDHRIASDPEFMTTINHLWEELTQHIKDEEENDLPSLEKALSEEESEKMEKSFMRSKMFAPTRSYPNAPDKPPFETVVGLLTAPIDQLRDLFNKFPENP